MKTSEFDPRTEVTVRVHRVAEELLGQPLAGPWRRGAAMGVDGVAIVLLANAPSVVFGIAASLVLLRASRGTASGGIFRRSFRAATRVALAVMVFVGAVSLWSTVQGRGSEGPELRALTDQGGPILGGRAGLLAGAEIMAFAMSDDEAEARRRAEAVARRLTGAGFQQAEIADLLVGIGASGQSRPWVANAADSIAATLRSPGEPVVDVEDPIIAAEALIPSYAVALASEDSAATLQLRAEVASRLAADTLGALGAALERERAQARELAVHLEEARDELADARDGGGFIVAFRNIREDLGLGLGWSGLYFTALVVLWRGQTLGKRLMGIRVVRLDGIPIGWWAAFERFGGYAAGLATGLLGFLQVFWDPNRQAVQDKISGTVVIRDRARAAAPTPPLDSRWA